jgi:hypothetical protein
MRARFGALALLGLILVISTQFAFAEACPWPRQKGAKSCKAHQKPQNKSRKKRQAQTKPKAESTVYSAKDSQTDASEVETVHTTQSAVAYSAAETSAADMEAMKNGLFSQNRGVEFRPTVSMQWFSVQNNRPDQSLIRTNWLGARAELDTAIVRFPILELGIDAAFFRTFTGLAPEARGTSATDVGAMAYMLWKANTNKVGIPMFRIGAGYRGNWREAESDIGFLPAVSGFAVSGEVSAIIDAMFAFGVNGGYVASHDGLYDLGAFISQKFLSDTRVGIWSARLGANVSLLMADQRRESWISILAGVTAAF